MLLPVSYEDIKGGGMADLKAFEEFSLFDSKNNVDNELEILQSTSLMEDVVTSMGLYFGYAVKGTVKTSEIYGKECPLLLSVSQAAFDTLASTSFTMEVQPSGKVLFADLMGKMVQWTANPLRYPGYSYVWYRASQTRIRPPKEPMRVYVTI